MGAALGKGDEFRSALDEAKREIAQLSQKKGHVVSRVKRLSHNTVAIKFETEEKLLLAPGGHVTLRSSNGFSRSYTPYLIEDDGFTIAVKRYEGGRVSPFLHQLRPGDFVTASAPIDPLFGVKGLDCDCLLLIAGGTGIAPLYSMAEHILRRGGNSTRVVLFACFRNEDDVLLGDELVALAKECAKLFSLYFVFSQAKPASYRGIEALNGRFNASHCKGRVKAASFAAICGPMGFGQTVCDVVEENVAVKPENITIM